VNGQLALLPDYGTVDFNGVEGAIAWDNLFRTLREAGSGNTINMVNASGASLSTAQILAPEKVRCTFNASTLSIEGYPEVV
jgi:hypothetical protein